MGFFFQFLSDEEPELREESIGERVLKLMRWTETHYKEILLYSIDSMMYVSQQMIGLYYLRKINGHLIVIILDF